MPRQSRNWRAKAVGYRDINAADSEGLPWIVDNGFVREPGELKAQLAGLQANGGGDEPESLLDALYKVTTMEATAKGAQSIEAGKWRYCSDTARVVVFTDTLFKETIGVPAAKGGSLQDVAKVVMARIILSVFAFNCEVYDRLSQIDKSEWKVLEFGISMRTKHCRSLRLTRQTFATRSNSLPPASGVPPQPWHFDARGAAIGQRDGKEAEGRRHHPGIPHHQRLR